MKKLKIESSEAAMPKESYFDEPPVNFEEEMPWIVREATPQEDYTLRLKFDDGKEGVYDMLPIILQEDGGDDAFAHLKNIDEFMKAYVHLHSVFWPGDISIAPEMLYKECMTIQEYEDWCAEDDDEDDDDEE